MEHFGFFLLVLFAFAAFLRDEYFFTILYLFVGLYLVGRWWSGRALKSLTIQRIFTNRAFIGEEVTVRLEVSNHGWLPLVWLQIQDSLPLELAVSGSFKRVLTLGSRERSNFEYVLQTRKRGCYVIGPFSASTGDLFSIGDDQLATVESEMLTVYPRIYHLPGFMLPSRSPMGTLKSIQPIYEDPTRVRSKRDYVAGDSWRRIDWKATAISGRLQVKQFEPSIALETVVFLNLNPHDYGIRWRFDGIELAVVVAASLANWVVRKKQAVGLVTNGVDPFSDPVNESGFQEFQPLLARKGQGQLMRILDVLARIVTSDYAQPFLELLKREYIHLAWGADVILVTPVVSEPLFDASFQLRRAGLNVVLVLVGRSPNLQQIRQQAQTFEIPCYHFESELELAALR